MDQEAQHTCSSSSVESSMSLEPEYVHVVAANMPFMGTPASISARQVALMAQASMPPSLLTSCTTTRIVDLGKSMMLTRAFTTNSDRCPFSAEPTSFPLWCNPTKKKHERQFVWGRTSSARAKDTARTKGRLVHLFQQGSMAQPTKGKKNNTHGGSVPDHFDC